MIIIYLPNQIIQTIPNFKKIIPKRNYSNNINIIKKDSNNNNKEEIGNIQFTMAGRTYKEQQHIIEILSSQRSSLETINPIKMMIILIKIKRQGMLENTI